MRDEGNNYPIHLPPRYPSKDLEAAPERGVERIAREPRDLVYDLQLRV